MPNFICPINTPRKTSNYGMRTHPVTGVRQLHAGVDLVNDKGGKVPVYSSADGTIRLIKNGTTGYGKYVIITHSINGVKYETVYAHLDSINVREGQKVYQGEKIGIMGNTGIGTGIHLHFEIHKGTYTYANGTYPTSIDPMKLINLSDTPNSLESKGDDLTVKQYEELTKKITQLEKQLDNKLDKPAKRAVAKSHEEAWKWLTSQGLSDGSNPQDYLSREQFASLLQRYHNKFVAKK